MNATSDDESEPGLPADIETVLRYAADVAARRLDHDVDTDHLVSTTEGMRSLLPLLSGSTGLRALLRRRIGDVLTDATARALIGDAPEASAAAVADVGRQLDQLRKHQRRQHRARRRANRPDADQKRTNRYEQRIAELRAIRDRHEQQLTTLRTENTELKATIENLDAELAQLRRHLDVAYARLERVQNERDQAVHPAPATTPAPALSRDLTPTVEVLGGGTEIGGSCVLVSAGGTRIVVDAGTRPSGVDEASLAPSDIDRLHNGPAPDAIIVTHAHNDHAGWVPALIARFGRIPIIASPPTCDLLGTMWADSAKVLARRADADESWAGGPLPPYRHSDVGAAVNALADQPLRRRRRVGAMEIELFPAGHIVGATGVIITAGPHRIVISGDVSLSGQHSVGGFELPPSGVGAELMLLESTYAGSGKQPPRSTIVDQLVADADRILGRGGRILIPAFALGRAQELALICKQYLPEAEVLVDGLARDLSHAYQRHPGPDGDRLSILAGNVRAVEPGRTRQEIADRRPCVVIATSGMLTAGPAVSWARDILAEPESGLMVVGYQDPDTPGSRLLTLAEHGGGVFELPDNPDPVTVMADVTSYRLGAHASEDELVEIAAAARPDNVMLVHGRPSGQRQFARRLELRGQHTVTADEVWQAN
ncbi:MBL fold metallo-hydrolase [Stackebrandtia soli]|uniref:MBL fold metallo-hydrolase n=1 Tax=Stackebrandtia soli TaxID=1892856 RepID=UPI0039E852C0